MELRATLLLGTTGVLAVGATVVALQTAGRAHAQPSTASTPEGSGSDRPDPDETPPVDRIGTAAFPPWPTTPATVSYAAKPAPVPEGSPEARRDEASLMSKLHEVGETNPAFSLQLAREGNRRFPESADAPERGWIVVKSLVNMTRFDEAEAEAVAMVAKYRGTSWAEDVERHMLSNPL